MKKAAVHRLRGGPVVSADRPAATGVSKRKDFPVVCVGGSAGGSDAYVTLLKHLPSDMGVAIVIVNHISRAPATLHKVLLRHTGMPVELITASLRIQPNHVFIIPADRDLHVLHGEFRLKPISKPNCLWSGWGWGSRTEQH